MSVPKKRSQSEKTPGGKDKRSNKDDPLPSRSSAVVPNAVTTHRWRNRKTRRKFKPISVSGVMASGTAEASATQSLDETPKWSVVSQCGGAFNPKTLFSNDEKYLFIATNKIVKVVSVRSGQTIRYLGLMSGKGKIVDFALDPGNEFRLMVAYDTQMLNLFDWTDGLLILHSTLPKVPKRLFSLKSTLLLLTSAKLFTCHLTPSTGTALQCTSNEVLDLASGHDAQNFIAVDATTSTVCLATDTKVHVSVDETTGTSFAQNRVAWKTLSVPNKITSIACTVDTVIVGEQSGVIRLYFDVIKSLHSNRLPTETLINWHQSPLTTLQLSRNGLYLLSSAGEDVLLISQITSGQRQFVPRLGSHITGIGQTASGSLYSLSLANNVIKIINAGDLEVISQISGVQPISPLSLEESRGDLPVASLQPSKQHLYLSADNDAAGTIQGYDIWLDQQSLRLDVGPISRTKTVGKDQREVFQPKVTHSAFTFDGSWLVTVDEWDDIYSLDQSTATETNLKFWAWNGRQWEISTKIEDPYGIQRHVLGLTSHPTENECATLGETGDIKVWRLLDTISNSSAPRVWSLRKHFGSRIPNISRKEGAIVYSTDATLLIAAVGIELLVIDSSLGHIIRCIHLAQPTSSLSTLGRQVLCLYRAIPMISGWDIPTGEATFSERLTGRCSNLAVNHSRSTFAFSTSNSSASRSSITISQLTGTEKVDVAQIALDSFASILLSAEFPDFSGYVVVDQVGQIKCIAPEHFKSGLPTDVVIHEGSTLNPKSVSKGQDGSGLETSNKMKGFRAQEIRNIMGISEKFDLAGIYESIIEKLVYE